MEFRSGLSGETSVGPAGLYRPMAEEDIFTLGTLAWRGGWFTTTGLCPTLLFRADLPEEYSIGQHSRSWTGKAIRCQWDTGGWDLQLRTTLPGPLWTLRGTELSLWFSYPVEPRCADRLDGGGQIPLLGGKGPAGAYLLDTRIHPLLLVTTAPVTFCVVSHRHWRLRFDQPGANVLVTALLREDDIPRDAHRQRIWKRLAACPPLECRDRFALEPDRLVLEQEFPGAAFAVRSPLLENALGRTSLIQGARGEPLCTTFFGPYALHEGSRVETTVATDWMEYGAVADRAVSGPLDALPEQLAFHGDVTWDESTPMDRLMSWRIWGSLIHLLPSEKQKALLSRLGVPTFRELREAMETTVEPANGRRWAFDKTVFASSGDTCYDTDWYNGLMLSGLDRASRCALEEVWAPAKELAREARALREEMVAYYEIYHDWRFWSAWTDAFGIIWNIDCAQNGLEGLLGEMRLRQSQDETSGAQWMRYLAGKSAAGIFSSMFWPDWLREQEITLGDVPIREDTFGIKGTYPHLRIGTVDSFTKNPYMLPRYFPAYSALLKLHGPIERLKELARSWSQDQPQRYSNWQEYYFDPELIRRMRPRNISIETGGVVCESGRWAVAMHHIIPEATLRVWVLGEEPEQVEQRYAHPLPLAEQLILRSGMQLRPVGADREPAFR